MRTYLKSDIAAIIKEPLAKVQAWTDSEIVNASISGSKGKGRARIYSYEDLVQFCMLKVWKDRCSYSLNDIKIYLDILRKGIPENCPSWDDITVEQVCEFLKNPPVPTATDAENIIYKDFFLNTFWGLKKEVVIATVKGEAFRGVPYSGVGQYTYIIHDRKQIEKLPFLKCLVQNYIGFTIVMCGNAKITAMNVFKLDRE